MQDSSVLCEKIKIFANRYGESVFGEFCRWMFRKITIHFNVTVGVFEVEKGDVFIVHLGKNIGSKLNKTRPCMVYSKKFANNGDTVVVIPIKSYKHNMNKNFSIFLPAGTGDINTDSFLDLTSIRQVSKKRLKKHIGKIDTTMLQRVDRKIIKIFGIQK